MRGLEQVRLLGIIIFVSACGGRSENVAHDTTGVPRAEGGTAATGGATAHDTTATEGGATTDTHGGDGGAINHGGTTSSPAGSASGGSNAGGPTTPSSGGSGGMGSLGGANSIGGTSHVAGAGSNAGGPSVAGSTSRAGAAGEPSVADEPCPELATDLDYKACKKLGQVCQYARIESGVECQLKYSCDKMWSKAYLCHSPEPCPLAEPALDSDCSIEDLQCTYLNVVFAWDDPPSPSLFDCNYPRWCKNGRWQVKTYVCGD
jgi:hypothetical protein